MTNDYIHHWDKKFRSRSWGRYPPEDLVRFMGRNYKHLNSSDIKVLEVGCGPGANLWFLHREGFDVSGIDGSETAIEIASQRLKDENSELNPKFPDLRAADFSELPWEDNQFDVVIDIFAIYANTTDVIVKVLNEVHRVLKPQGRFYSKLWGRGCTGYGQGTKIEEGTYDNIPKGPCYDMGVSHFFDETEIKDIFQNFQIDAIDTLHRTEQNGNVKIEEYMCQFTKRAS